MIVAAMDNRVSASTGAQTSIKKELIKWQEVVQRVSDNLPEAQYRLRVNVLPPAQWRCVTTTSSFPRSYDVTHFQKKKTDTKAACKKSQSRARNQNIMFTYTICEFQKKTNAKHVTTQQVYHSVTTKQAEVQLSREITATTTDRKT